MLKTSILTFLICFSFCKGSAQDYYFQDPSRYPIELIQLEKKLFPLQPKYSPYPSELYCFEKTPVRLVQRQNLTPPDTTIEYLRRVFFLKDTSLVPELLLLYERHLDYFQAEWGWAILLAQWCEELQKQIEIIDAFETVIYGLLSKSKYADPEDYYLFIIKRYHAQIIPLYYKIFYYNDADSLNIINRQGRETFYKIRSFTPSQIKEMNELKLSKRKSDLTKKMHVKYNFFGGSNLPWNLFTPFLEDIKPYILQEYEEYLRNQDQKSYSTFLQRSFFTVYLKKYDFIILDLNPPKD